ncbi:hypothetical protein CIW83_07280 [Tissierella sp. P1]|jgi:ABC-type multidrug transport system fused ATPase/permease subunit|uniref:hypothetical protein n=1 Tax=Tissierella TaxID=41273 RepID=UPI000B9FAC0F|nr:hypothetical protein [Tissierella sp. P1]OZV12693.1 hypothetical protein CIW83_07280 [Tissierella sp. P1]
MYEGYNKIFWGIFIATFNIKFGTMKIFPAFVGLLVISRGLGILYEETKLKLFHKVHNMGILATSISFIGGVIDYFSNGSLNSSIAMSIWAIMYNVIELILFFKTLESSIEYLDTNDYSEVANENIGKLRTYTICSIINISLMSFALLFNFRILMSVVAFIAIILRIFMMVLIGRLKKLFIEVELSDE